MTLAVVWLPEAMAAYRSLRVTDAEGTRRVARAVGMLADEPRPEGSSRLGRTSYVRLRLGEYRILYEVTPDAVYVMHVGRVLRA